MNLLGIGVFRIDSRFCRFVVKLNSRVVRVVLIGFQCLKMMVVRVMKLSLVVMFLLNCGIEMRVKYVLLRFVIVLVRSMFQNWVGLILMLMVFVVCGCFLIVCRCRFQWVWYRFYVIMVIVMNIRYLMKVWLNSMGLMIGMLFRMGILMCGKCIGLFRVFLLGVSSVLQRKLVRFVMRMLSMMLMMICLMRYLIVNVVSMLVISMLLIIVLKSLMKGFLVMLESRVVENVLSSSCFLIVMFMILVCLLMMLLSVLNMSGMDSEIVLNSRFVMGMRLLVDVYMRNVNMVSMLQVMISYSDGVWQVQVCRNVLIVRMMRIVSMIQKVVIVGRVMFGSESVDDWLDRWKLLMLLWGMSRNSSVRSMVVLVRMIGVLRWCFFMVVSCIVLFVVWVCMSDIMLLLFFLWFWFLFWWFFLYWFLGGRILIVVVVVW